MNALGASGLLALFSQFLVLSLLSVGGAITTAPDMHRYLVAQQHWITDTQFSASVAIAQAAPGPNVLFVAVLGWNVAGASGALAAMSGILLPSTVLSLWAGRWGTRHRQTRGVRAFTLGLAPITIGLLLSTGWLLTEPFLKAPGQRVGAVGLVGITVMLMLRTRISPMWLVGLGAAAGAIGWV
jgi:chromate transporter